MLTFLENLLLCPDFQPKQFAGESQPKLWTNMQARVQVHPNSCVPACCLWQQCFTLQHC